MRNRLVRPFLVVVFLVALETTLTFWSQVGGQYHLDLMFWGWKFGLSVAAASLTTAIAGELARGAGAVRRRAYFYFSSLLAVAAMAGVVTYYYHLHEPDDQQDQGDEPTQMTPTFYRR